MIPFWCLMPKGEKLRPKQMDQLPLENFENSRVRAFVLSKYSCYLLLLKVGLLWGECLIMGKRGSFWILINFTLGISLFMPKQVSLTQRQENEFDLQKQTQWWQRAIKICQIIVKNNLVFNCIDVALILVAFGCVGINHQKGEIEREMCLWAISIMFW